MRPRVFPAEDPEVVLSAGADAAASMRPRVFPAEDVETRYNTRAGRMLQ